MTLEIFAVAVVELGEIEVLGRSQPLPGRVINEDAADAIR